MRNTGPTRDVLRAIRSAQRGSTYGAEVMERTGLRGGTVYPILYRLEREGWVSAWWSCDPGTPARRHYELTEYGVASMREWGLI